MFLKTISDSDKLETVQKFKEVLQKCVDTQNYLDEMQRKLSEVNHGYDRSKMKKYFPSLMADSNSRVSQYEDQLETLGKRLNGFNNSSLGPRLFHGV